MGRSETKPARRGLGRFLCFKPLVRNVEGGERWVTAPNTSHEITGHPGGVPLSRESLDSGAAILDYLGMKQIAHCASSSSVLLQAAHAAALERSLNAVGDDDGSTEALTHGLSQLPNLRGAPDNLANANEAGVADAAEDSPSMKQISPRLLEQQMMWGAEETEDSTGAHAGKELPRPPVPAAGSSAYSASSSTTSNTQTTPGNPTQLQASARLSTPAQSQDHIRGMVPSSDESGLQSSGIPSPMTTSSPLPLPGLRCLASDAPDHESETEHAASTGYRASRSASSDLTTPVDSSSIATRVSTTGTEHAAATAIGKPPLPPSSTRSGSLVDLTLCCSSKADSLNIGACLLRGEGLQKVEQQQGAARAVVMRRHTAVVLVGDNSSEDEEDGFENALPPARRTKSVQRRLSGVYEGHHVHLQKLRKQMGDTNEPPGDLLSLMARRVFSSQGVMARVNSDGVISGMDARSSFNTPSNFHTPSSEIAESPSLPRIRTRVSTTNASTHF